METLAAGALAPWRASTAQTAPSGSLTDVPGIRVGHFTDSRRPTGCTAILFDSAAAAGIDYDGSAPGESQAVLLQPVSPVERIHGIFLTGGGVLALPSAGGVLRFLEERKVGFDWGTPDLRIPIVVSAVIDDLAVGDPHIRVDDQSAYKACAAATAGPVAEGNVGAGAGATLGKMHRGRGLGGMKGGLGTASLKLGDVVLGALAVVNAAGDVSGLAHGSHHRRRASIRWSFRRQRRRDACDRFRHAGRRARRRGASEHDAGRRGNECGSFEDVADEAGDDGELRRWAAQSGRITRPATAINSSRSRQRSCSDRTSASHSSEHWPRISSPMRSCAPSGPPRASTAGQPFATCESSRSEPRVTRSTRTLTLVIVTLLMALLSVQHASARAAAAPAHSWLGRLDRAGLSLLFVCSRRRAAPDQGLPANNLTPRALVLRVGRESLGRVRSRSASRRGDLARTWRDADGAGARVVPAPRSQDTAVGRLRCRSRTARYGSPTASILDGRRVSVHRSSDPREPAPSPEEVGRGPLAEEVGRFTAVRQVADGVVLEYTAGGADVRERLAVSEENSAWTFTRHFRVGTSTRTLWLVLGFKPAEIGLAISGKAGGPPPAKLTLESYPDTSHDAAAKVWAVRLPPRPESVEFSVVFKSGPMAPPAPADAIPSDAPVRRWPQEVITTTTRSTAKDAYVVDDIALPLDNPWRRNVRLERHPVPQGRHRRRRDARR